MWALVSQKNSVVMEVDVPLSGELEANEWFSVPIGKSNKPVDVGRGNLLDVSHGNVGISVLEELCVDGGRRVSMLTSSCDTQLTRTHFVASLPSRRVALLTPSAFWRRSRAFHSSAPPGPNVDGRKASGERETEKDVTAESRVLESAVKAMPDAEAHANRAECLCTQFIVVKRLLTGPGAHPVPSAASTSLLFSRTLPAPYAACASSALYPAPGHGHAPNRARPSLASTPAAIRHRALDVRCGIHAHEMQPHEQGRPRAGGAALRRVRKGLRWEEAQDCFGVHKAVRSKRAWSCSRCGFAQRQLKYNCAGKPLNNAVPCQGAPAPESASPPVNPGLNVFSAEEQATICSFLSTVGMSEAEALADDGVGYSAALDADIEAHIAMSERRRVVERMWAGSGRCWIESRHWSVTSPHNFGRIFSSPALRLVLAVGSIGFYLKTYEECDTFLSTDAGLHWKMVSKEANKYEFGDQGSIMVLIHDEDSVNETKLTESASRKSLKLQYRIRARALTTVPDSMLQKFMLVGQLARKDQTDSGRFVVIFLDFASTRSRQCTDSDFEKWYARSRGQAVVL
ncbi:hypothetical protein DFH11DRAFT_1749978 [Phellopilus nigrolimitatus]|nr:hypothetical protein DFH11DRAFT_1749978 [Phellopilus nigrolimitatus]